jgi:nucleotide-binding universal stress UspA family protein
MRVLCCLDGTNAEKVTQAAAVFSASQSHTLGVLYVIDTGPRKDIEHTRERFLRPRGTPLPREGEMHLAEHTAAEDILSEGLHYLPGAERIQRQGRPEREIVNAAADWQADVLVVCPRAEYGGKPTIGPKSVGHVARFVLDHAPCPVLLVRPYAREQFPISK